MPLPNQSSCPTFSPLSSRAIHFKMCAPTIAVDVTSEYFVYYSSEKFGENRKCTWRIVAHLIHCDVKSKLPCRLGRVISAKQDLEFNNEAIIFIPVCKLICMQRKITSNSMRFLPGNTLQAYWRLLLYLVKQLTHTCNTLRNSA